MYYFYNIASLFHFTHNVAAVVSWIVCLFFDKGLI